MPETAEDFKKRVYGFESKSIYLDENNFFNTGGGLVKKIDESGRMRSFCGNTVVFLIKETTPFAERVSYMQSVLHTMCHNILAERLSSRTLHMTLHDLMNGNPQELSKENTAELGERVKLILSKIKMQPFRIRLQTTWVFNMVNTSIVLGLEPCTQYDWDILTGIYDRIDDIYHLDYPYTPHITLAYFKPGSYCGDDMIKLDYTLKALSEEKLTVEFSEEDLVYQVFSDMNSYFIS